MRSRLSDAKLLAAWRDGDTGAGQELFLRVDEQLYRFFAPRAADAVEDLMQETMMSVLESHARLRRATSFRSFVLGIAHNKLRSHYRVKNRQALRHADEPSSMEDPTTSLSQREQRNQVHEILSRSILSLPLQQQLLIELTYWECMSSAEIAEVLGVAPSTVRGRRRVAEKALARALAAIREAPPHPRHEATQKAASTFS